MRIYEQTSQEPSEWRTMLGRLNLSTVDLREGRYDGECYWKHADLTAPSSDFQPSNSSLLTPPTARGHNTAVGPRQH